MATTKYSSWIDTKGGKNFLRCYLTYTTSSDNTKYVIDMTSGCGVKDGWYTMAKLTNLLSWTGGSTSKTVDDTNWKSGNHKMTAKKLEVTKTHSAQTINISGKLSSAVDDASVSASFSVPAKPSYTVKQYSNGSLWSTKTKWYSETLALGTPTRTGYTFGGWWTGNNGTGTNYGTSYTGNAAVTLYAKWTAVNTTQNFNANGGAFSGGSKTTSKTVAYDGTLAFNSVSVPTRSGYTFNGWAKSATATSGYTQSQSVKITSTAAQTWYATWKAVNTTQNFNANGGAFSDGSTTTSKTVVYAGTLAFNSVGVPTRAGYVFTGWAKSSKAKGDYWTNQSVKITSPSAQIWYACWTANYIPPSINAADIMAYRIDAADATDAADEGLFGYVRAKFKKGQRVAYNGTSFTYTDVDVTKVDALLDGVSGDFVQRSLDNTTRIAEANTTKGDFTLERTYKVTLRLYDEHSGSEAVVYTAQTAISAAFYTMDVSADFRSIGFGVTADDDISETDYPKGLMKVAMEVGIIDADLEAAVQTLGWTDCIG